MELFNIGLIVGGYVAALLNVWQALTLLSRADPTGGPVMLRGSRIAEPRLQAYSFLSLASTFGTMATGRVLQNSSPAAVTLEVGIVGASLLAFLAFEYARRRRLRRGPSEAQ